MSALGMYLLGALYLRGGYTYSPGHIHPPDIVTPGGTWDQAYPPRGQTDTSENITFPQPPLRAVINRIDTPLWENLDT